MLRRSTVKVARTWNSPQSIPIGAGVVTLITSVVITGIDSMEILDQACEAVRTFHPLGKQERDGLLEKTAKAATTGRYEPFKTTSIFDGTAVNPEWLGEEPQRVQALMPE